MAMRAPCAGTPVPMGDPQHGREPLSDDSILLFGLCFFSLGCALKSTKETGTPKSTAINPGDCIGVEGDSPETPIQSHGKARAMATASGEKGKYVRLFPVHAYKRG